MVQMQSALICSLHCGAFLLHELNMQKINKPLNIFDMFFKLTFKYQNHLTQKLIQNFIF